MRAWIVSLAGCLAVMACSPHAPAEGPEESPAHSAIAISASASKSKMVSYVPSAEPPPAVLPTDVNAFMEMRDQCDHWRGEYGDDDERNREVKKGVEGTCTGTDAKLSALREKYKGDPDVIAALADYEDRIEF